MQNMSSARGEELMKGVFRKRAIDKGNNVIESNQINDSKKKSNVSGHHNQQNQGGNELMNVVRKGTEKLSIKENKCKSGPHSKVCYCAPTTHEGSFRCRLHRKKSATDDNNKSNLRLNSQYGMVEFQPQMPSAVIINGWTNEELSPEISLQENLSPEQCWFLPRKCLSFISYIDLFNHPSTSNW
ncbi:uncharacterized protein [Glycine max]|nr:uncharacterized protein LOC100806208 isoform X4 [Glycine max]